MSTSTGKDVLLIDDDPVVFALMEQYLASLGHTLLPPRELDNTLTLAKTLQPDIIFIDLFMPERSGFDVLQDLRQDPATKHIPVIIITATPDPEAAATHADFKPDHYLLKPFTAAEVAAVIDSI